MSLATTSPTFHFLWPTIDHPKPYSPFLFMTTLSTPSTTSWHSAPYGGAITLVTISGGGPVYPFASWGQRAAAKLGGIHASCGRKTVDELLILLVLGRTNSGAHQGKFRNPLM
ncbi:hypothetical protein Tco_0514962 [Tanacetum coccineum]